jgi:hypothetical protein
MQEVCHGEAEVYTGVQEAARLIKERGKSIVPSHASKRDIGISRRDRHRQVSFARGARTKAVAVPKADQRSIHFSAFFEDSVDSIWAVGH